MRDLFESLFELYEGIVPAAEGNIISADAADFVNKELEGKNPLFIFSPDEALPVEQEGEEFHIPLLGRVTYNFYQTVVAKNLIDDYFAAPEDALLYADSVIEADRMGKSEIERISGLLKGKEFNGFICDGVDIVDYDLSWDDVIDVVYVDNSPFNGCSSVVVGPDEDSSFISIDIMAKKVQRGE